MNKLILSLEVIIPTYNGAKTIKQTLLSLLHQSFQDFTVLIHDDYSTDNTLDIVRTLNDSRIRIVQNKKNLTCQKNLEAARKKSQADIVFWLCQDDILAIDTLAKTYTIFIEQPEVGAVVRPYFWFDSDIKTPVRAISQLNPLKDEIITICDGFERIKLFFDAAAQLSGLAYRNEYFSHRFHEDTFPGHVYVFASILKKHPVVFLKDYAVAVRIDSSQTRSVSSIYEKSPIESWVQMYQRIFPEKQFEKLRRYFILHYVAVNYLGLLQIRNYSTFNNFTREVYYLIKYRPINLITPFFILIVLICIFIPPILLIKIVDVYKREILSRTLPQITFEAALE